MKNFLEIREKIHNILETNAPEEIMLVFDIDMTLIQPKHKAVRLSAAKAHFELTQSYLKKLTKAEIDALLTIANIEGESELVDLYCPQIIEEFQNKNIKIIALTAALLGSYHYNIPLEEIKYQRLVNLGIDFNKFWSPNPLVFTELEAYVGHHPLFYKGILYANGEHNTYGKGTVLKAFLKHQKLSPKVIIMVDDKREHLVDVTNVLKSYEKDIHVIGIEFRRALDSKDIPISVDEYQVFWRNIFDKLGLNE